MRTYYSFTPTLNPAGRMPSGYTAVPSPHPTQDWSCQATLSEEEGHFATPPGGYFANSQVSFQSSLYWPVSFQSSLYWPVSFQSSLYCPVSFQSSL